MLKQELEKVVETLGPDEILAVDSIIIQGNSQKAFTRGVSMERLRQKGLVSFRQNEHAFAYCAGPITHFFEITANMAL